MVDSVNVHIQLHDQNNRIKHEIRQTISALTQKMMGSVITKLNGSYLKVGEGRLWQSVTNTVNVNENYIEGKVLAGGTYVKYTFIHEFGLTGAVNIKSHLRQIKQAFGKPITPRQVLVKAHSRNVQFRERRFMRDSLDEIAKIVPKNIDAAIQRGLSNGQ